MGLYLKGHGYTPIYACAVTQHTRKDGYSEDVVKTIGAGLSFETAVGYANGWIDSLTRNGWDILDEGYSTGATGTEIKDSYYWYLVKGEEDYCLIDVNKLPLMHK